MTDPTLAGIALTPIVMGIVEVLKSAGLPTKFAPLASLLLGVVAGLVMQYTLPHPQISRALVTGCAVGLAASGLFSGTLALAKQTPPPDAEKPPAK